MRLMQFDLRGLTEPSLYVQEIHRYSFFVLRIARVKYCQFV